MCNLFPRHFTPHHHKVSFAPMIKWFLAAVFVGVCLIVEPVSATCRALALSGGGAHGAWEIGVLSGLVDSLPPGDVAWDVVSGISAGSINAAGISTFAVGDEKNMTATLTDMWTSINRKDVYKNWPGGFVSVLKRSGIFDSSPLRQTIKDYIGDPPNILDRKLVVGATSLDTATLHTWTEADRENLVDAVMCSTAIPGVFPSQTYPGIDDTFSDGGTIMVINIFDAVRRCQETEKDNKNIIVDIVTTVSDAEEVIDASVNDVLGILERYRSITGFLKVNSAIEDAQQAFPDVTWRYNIAPTGKFPWGDLNFDPKDLQKMIDMGREEAENAIKNQRK